MKKFKGLFLVIACLVLSIALTSCDLFSILYDTGDDDTDSSYSSSMQDTPSGDNITNNIVIEGEGGNLVYAINSSLRSAVSVYCNFETSSLGGSATSAGSGVIYELDGKNGSAFIITNYHVVYESSSKTSNKISDDIFIMLYGMEYSDYAIPATYVGGSMNYDIAVLYVENSDILKNAYNRVPGSAPITRKDIFNKVDNTVKNSLDILKNLFNTVKCVFEYAADNIRHARESL